MAVEPGVRLLAALEIELWFRSVVVWDQFEFDRPEIGVPHHLLDRVCKRIRFVVQRFVGLCGVAVRLGEPFSLRISIFSFFVFQLLQEQVELPQK